MKPGENSKKKWSVALAATLAFMTSACATTGGLPPTVIDTWCLNDRPISIDVANDTERTVNEILVHNGVYEEHCKDVDQ